MRERVRAYYGEGKERVPACYEKKKKKNVYMCAPTHVCVCVRVRRHARLRVLERVRIEMLPLKKKEDKMTTG